MDNIAWWYNDGRWVHPDDATISINDIAVLRGYSVFESLRTYYRRPFYLDEHVTRLYRSAVLIEMTIKLSSAQIAEVIRATIALNTYLHASIRLLITGGVSEDGILPSCSPT